MTEKTKNLMSNLKESSLPKMESQDFGSYSTQSNFFREFQFYREKTTKELFLINQVLLEIQARVSALENNFRGAIKQQKKQLKEARK